MVRVSEVLEDRELFEDVCGGGGVGWAEYGWVLEVLEDCEWDGCERMG